MKVIRGTAEQIEKINNNGHFNTDTLGKDIHGVHFYGYNSVLENGNLTDDQKALVEGMEKVEFDTIEREEI